MIEATASRQALLVLTEADYPGWRATVDGLSVPVIRADTVFRAVAVTAGTHEIRFEFAPWSVRLGAAASGFALFATVMALAWTYRRPTGAP